MKTKMILTSFVALGFAMPAVATPSHTGTFPANGLMQEDYKYTNAAVDANMPTGFEFANGSTLYAKAKFVGTEYTLVKSKYLPKNSEELSFCTAGYYCPGYYPEENGSSTVYYSTTTDQGIYRCPQGFANSDAKAKSQFQCYRACANTDVLHAASVETGRNYYGAPADSCAPSACEKGWHVQAPEDSGIANQDLINTIGSTPGGAYAYVNDHGTFSAYEPGGSASSKGQEYFSMYTVKNGFWAVDYQSQGIISGTSRTSRILPGQNGATTADMEDSPNAGQYCFCRVTGYKPYDSDGVDLDVGVKPWQKLVLNGSSSEQYVPWEYAGDNAAGDGVCALRCATYMKDTPSQHMQGSSTFRNAMLYNAKGITPAQCVLNRINIEWQWATQTDVSANSAGWARYTGSIRTPVKATPPAGQTFTGWEFSTTKWAE